VLSIPVMEIKLFCWWCHVGWQIVPTCGGVVNAMVLTSSFFGVEYAGKHTRVNL